MDSNPPATVEDIVALVEALTPQERARLVSLITGEASDDEPLAWESDGWDSLT